MVNSLRSILALVCADMPLWGFEVSTHTPAQYNLTYLVRVNNRQWRRMPVVSIIVAPYVMANMEALLNTLCDVALELPTDLESTDPLPTMPHTS